MCTRSALQQVHLSCTDLDSCSSPLGIVGLMSKLALHQHKEEMSPLTLMKLVQSVKLGQVRAESGYGGDLQPQSSLPARQTKTVCQRRGFSFNLSKNHEKAAVI